MTAYSDIIQQNKQLHSPVAWWPNYAFHYTDVQNAVSILDSGFLYSRLDASALRLMQNENASSQVISMTNADTESKVRFYFRPMTPTQYYNEGFKHRMLRYDGDENANIPLPVFFLFDLAEILSIPGVEFSEKSMAGRGAERFSGPDAFSKMNFDAIYSNDFENYAEKLPYRHAEILHPKRLEISSPLRHILCRNQFERMTLLNLLKEKNYKSFLTYKNIVKVPDRDVFYNNGLFIDECLYNNRVLSISFSNTYPQKKYTDRMKEKNQINQLPYVAVIIILIWQNSRGVITQNQIKTYVDYEHPGRLTIDSIPVIPNAKELAIRIFIEEKPVCYLIHPIMDSEVLR